MWTRIFETSGLTRENVASRLQAGSERLIGILSGRMAADPAWLTAGAVANMGAIPPDTPGLEDAVRAAALLSLVLDAEGHNEMAITRMVDDTISDEAPQLRSEDQISDWLDNVHLRYRDSERREAGR